MSTFRTEQDLRHALSEAGLDSLADRIVATMRPAIQFVRRQQPDDALPPGTSKIGGLPDLPLGFAWPHRRSPADADTRIRALREQRIRDRERSASSRSQRPSDDILALLSEHERDAWLRSIEAGRPDPDKLRAIQAQDQGHPGSRGLLRRPDGSCFGP
ncbi:YwqG family protein [Burkholderia cenocepacia]|uniref:YwqG family protein n=1 Tax=Burkholderia cenocepacia TaxID=95486 RepID=UPI0020139562|nr:YwqG family protein [Burkholderia cenocepacia]